MQSYGATVATELTWCIYDAGDDCIIVEGSYIEMNDLIDTMAGNLHILTLEDVETIRNRVQ